MKKAILGVISFAVLCSLAYYSSQLYTDKVYDENQWSLELEPGQQPDASKQPQGQEETGAGDGAVLGGAGTIFYAAGEQKEDLKGGGFGAEGSGANKQSGQMEGQLREASMPSDLVKSDLGDEEELGYRYYLVEEFGYVNIYEEDMETIFEYTDIPIRNLPEELQEEICMGKGLISEQELYDFLENYSS